MKLVHEQQSGPDAFENGNISPAFMTSECFSAIAQRLSLTGIFAADYLYNQHLHQTIKELCIQTFTHVWRIQVADSSNYIILASQKGISPERIGNGAVHPRLAPLAQFIQRTIRTIKTPGALSNLMREETP